MLIMVLLNSSGEVSYKLGILSKINGHGDENGKKQ